MKYELIHGGADGCGKPAFLLAELPQVGRTIDDTTVLHLDGRPVLTFGSVECASCSRMLTKIMTGWVRERELEAA